MHITLANNFIERVGINCILMQSFSRLIHVVIISYSYIIILSFNQLYYVKRKISIMNFIIIVFVKFKLWFPFKFHFMRFNLIIFIYELKFFYFFPRSNYVIVGITFLLIFSLKFDGNI